MPANIPALPSRPRTAITFTTIHDGAIIGDLTHNLATFKRQDHVGIYAIPDRKTSPAFYDNCRVAASRGFTVIFPTIDEQDAFLATLPACPPIPEQNDNRRNVGYLLSLRDKNDVLIALDDDNFPEANVDFVGEHLHGLSETGPVETVETPTRFWNNCTLLDFPLPIEAYPRGYPMERRHVPTIATVQRTSIPTWINAGMWLHSPDVDAIDWLAFGPALRTEQWKQQNMRLGPSTWCPVNSQNTALRSELVAAYYFLLMASDTIEFPVERYGDIFSGYFVLKCIKTHGATVNFGSPAVRHMRNVHNYARDARSEMLFLAVIDDFLDWLMDVQLTSVSIADTYIDLAQKLDDQIERFESRYWTPGLKRHMHRMTMYMQQWVQTVTVLGGVS